MSLTPSYLPSSAAIIAIIGLHPLAKPLITMQNKMRLKPISPVSSWKLQHAIFHSCWVFLAIFEVISHGLENFLTQSKTVWFGFFESYENQTSFLLLTVNKIMENKISYNMPTHKTRHLEPLKSISGFLTKDLLSHIDASAHWDFCPCVDPEIRKI